MPSGCSSPATLISKPSSTRSTKAMCTAISPSRGTPKSSERLNRLVDQLIKMHAAQRFDRPLERRPTDLAALLNQAVQDVRPFVELRHQVLALDLATDLGTLDVEADKIRDAVDNLLLNAIKFTPDAGRIHVSAKRTAAG